MATRLSSPGAQALNGAEVVLAASSAEVELCVALFADSMGMPGELRVQGAPVTLGHAGPRAHLFTFEPTAMPSGALWLGVKVLRGSLVALLGGAGPMARKTSGGFVLHAGPVQGFAARLLRASPSPEAARAAGMNITLAGQALPPPAHGPSEVQIGPFADSLNAAPAPEFVVESTARAVVTISPPMLHYTLPD